MRKKIDLSFPRSLRQTSNETSESRSERRRRLRGESSGQSGSRSRIPAWQLWAILLGLGTIGTGIAATALLLRLPTVPNCPTIFWPTASASMRLYCGQLAANKNTVDDLLEAIELVSQLPDDHSLRPTIDQHIQMWTQELLELGEKSFQAGKLATAIETARRIPTDKLPPQARRNTEAAIEARIEGWKAVWSRAEEIYEEIETHLNNRRWAAAFRAASELLSVGNEHWETTQYQEITQRVQQARDDTNKLANAQNLANRGTVDSILEAIGMAEQIGLESPAYQVAQEALQDFGRKLLDLAEAELAAQNLTEAISIARKVPASTQVKEEAQDFVVLARARFLAWQPSISNLQNAIDQAEKIALDSPLYNRAQTLIDQWNTAIDQVALLERARDYARTGSVADLTAAITQAELISSSTPLYDEAQREIDRWRDRLQTSEDRPILQQAEALARQGDYRGAIAQARQIGSSRALYDEAQSSIYRWQQTISEERDRPILQRAEQLANAGNLDDAIATARQISSDSGLYNEAQSAIARWSSASRDRALLDEAYDLARGGSAESLEAAIRTANGISSYGGSRPQADDLIRDLSWQLVERAETEAFRDLYRAIEIAERIPTYSTAYAEARRLIGQWERQLNPEPPATDPKFEAEERLELQAPSDDLGRL